MYFRSTSTLLFYGGRLFQQYVVDNYVKIESTHLNYLHYNQNKICRELYQGLQDSFQSGTTNASDVRQHIILPSTFIDGPCDMYQRYQDAKTLVQIYGKPDLFITITCNPRWPEIITELLSEQTPQDRPDLIGKILIYYFKINNIIMIIIIIIILNL